MRIRLRDFEMEFEQRGQGAPLLLVHGFPLNRKMWEEQIEVLSSSRQVLAPDLRGYGDSSFTRGRYTMDLLAKDLYEFLDAIDIKEPVVLGGLSMGGYVAFAFYRAFPERVAGLILAATRAAPDTEEGKVRREEMAALALESGANAIAAEILPKMLSPKTYEKKPEVVQRLQNIMENASKEGLAGALLGMKERPDSRPLLETIDRPTLIIHGADDQLVPPEEARSMQSAIRNSKVEILQEAGHMLNLEQPVQFNRAVGSFLDTL